MRILFTNLFRYCCSGCYILYMVITFGMVGNIVNQFDYFYSWFSRRYFIGNCSQQLRYKCFADFNSNGESVACTAFNNFRKYNSLSVHLSNVFNYCCFGCKPKWIFMDNAFGVVGCIFIKLYYCNSRCYQRKCNSFGQ